MNCGLQGKLLSAVGALALGLGIVMLLALAESFTLIRKTRSLKETNVASLSLAHQLSVNFSLQTALVSRASTEMDLKKIRADQETFLKHEGMIHKTIASLQELLTEKDILAQLNSIKEKIPSFSKNCQKVYASSSNFLQQEAVETLQKLVLPVQDEIIHEINVVTESIISNTADAPDRIISTAKTWNGLLMSVSLIVVVGGVSSAWMILDRQMKFLSQAVSNLSTSSSQVDTIARQVARFSSELDQSVNRQVASIEETSSSLEEILGMTRQNTENAVKVKDLATEAREAGRSGVSDIEEMNSAVTAIKNSSHEISKIIKTIDEIAFQTNILALNAAVEAARAGESGLGFSVVADEVRNLAQRSAVAANETTQKIEQALSRTQNGVTISSKVAESLHRIVTKSSKVDDLIAEVATASKEQSQGISQINEALAGISHSTQSNAASAEETAAASEELNEQSRQLQSVIENLLVFIHGSAIESHSSPPQSVSHASDSNTSKTPSQIQVVCDTDKPLLTTSLTRTQKGNTPPLEHHFKDF